MSSIRRSGTWRRPIISSPRTALSSGATTPVHIPHNTYTHILSLSLSSPCSSVCTYICPFMKMVYNVYSLSFVPCCALGGKNLVLVAMCLPTLLMVLEFTMSLNTRSQPNLKLFAPLCLLPLSFADVFSIQILAVLSMMGSLCQIYCSSTARQRGNKVI